MLKILKIITYNWTLIKKASLDSEFLRNLLQEHVSIWDRRHSISPLLCTCKLSPIVNETSVK